MVVIKGHAVNPSESLAGCSITPTPGGGFRVDIPATTFEADDLEGLVAQLEKRLHEMEALVQSLGDDTQAVAYKALERVIPRGEALAKYAKDHPPPPAWLDEPECWGDEPE